MWITLEICLALQLRRTRRPVESAFQITLPLLIRLNRQHIIESQEELDKPKYRDCFPSILFNSCDLKRLHIGSMYTLPSRNMLRSEPGSRDSPTTSAPESQTLQETRLLNFDLGQASVDLRCCLLVHFTFFLLIVFSSISTTHNLAVHIPSKNPTHHVPIPFPRPRRTPFRPNYPRPNFPPKTHAHSLPVHPARRPSPPRNPLPLPRPSHAWLARRRALLRAPRTNRRDHARIRHCARGSLQITARCSRGCGCRKYRVARDGGRGAQGV